MNGDFVPFEIAKKLKEKGFREECFARYYCSDEAYFERNSYHPDTESVFYCYNNDEDLGRFYIDAPTISQVLKWLREKDIDLVISPVFFYDDVLGKMREYGCKVFTPSLNKPEHCGYHEKWEQAALAGIEYVIDNSYEEALKYEKLCKKVDGIMSQLLPRTKEIEQGTDFNKHNKETLNGCFKAFCQECAKQIPGWEQWFTETANGIRHLSHIGKTLSDYRHKFPCLYDTYFRFCCIDFNTGFEFQQPYYVTHQDEFFNGLKRN